MPSNFNVVAIFCVLLLVLSQNVLLNLVVRGQLMLILAALLRVFLAHEVLGHDVLFELIRDHVLKLLLQIEFLSQLWALSLGGQVVLRVDAGLRCLVQVQ